MALQCSPLQFDIKTLETVCCGIFMQTVKIELERDKITEVDCNFCTKKYQVTQNIR